MNFLNDQQGKMNVIDLSTFYFVRLFRGFSLSVQPGKMFLAVIIVILMYATGWLLDFLAGSRYSVLSDDIYDFNNSSEIAWYAANCKISEGSVANVKEFREAAIDSYTSQLLEVMALPVMKETIGDNPLRMIRSGQIGDILCEKYSSMFERNYNALAERHAITRANMIAGFSRNKQVSEEDKLEFDFQQMQLLDDIDAVYSQVSHAMVDGKAEEDVSALLGKVITVNTSLAGQEFATDQRICTSLKTEITDVITLARAVKVSQAMRGKGVFAAIADFKLTRLHNLAVSLVLLDFEKVKDIAYELAFGSIWMFRNHMFYVVVLYLAAFCVYAVFGGAICRIAALQVTRQEHVGTIEALLFSFRRFRQLFLVPVMPLLVAVVCGLGVTLLSWLSLIPIIGPVIMTISMAVMFGLGCLMAVVIIGLTVGHGLMYPAVTVDNADAFDAMSRAFTYILRKPWHLTAYTFIAAIYGIICYVFLRSFVLIVFACVRVCFTPGWDIDAIWPLPSFTNLMPAVQWHQLAGADTIYATIIILACQLFALALPAYALSYYYTTSTQIYIMLRKHEDEIELSECYLETHVNELFEEISFQTTQNTPQSETSDTCKSPLDTDTPA